MPVRSRRKRWLPVTALTSVLVVGIAYSYWTAGGTGSGDATAGSDAGVAITDVVFSDDLYPGATVDVSFDVDNLSGDTPVKVGEVVADTGTHANGISFDVGHASCNALWFTYSGTTLDQEINASATYSAPPGAGAGNGGTLTMSNESVNQDACKGATITLHLIVDNSSI